MAELTIAGVTYPVRPFKLRELRQAAPAIDRVTARSQDASVGAMERMTASIADMLEVCAAGIEGKTAAELVDEMSMADMPALKQTFDTIMVEAGLKAASGEVKPAAAPADPSPSESMTSSPSLSAPDAETGTA